MTDPAGGLRLDAALLDAKRPALRSVLLLFGLLPIDVHTFGFARVDPPTGFHETSHSCSSDAGSTCAPWSRCPPAAASPIG